MVTVGFPVYVIILIVLIIIVSSHSTKFSNLIGKKEPVATLATLILLSYAKLVGVSFKSLSRGILVYPNRNVSLRLPDATIEYPSMNMDQSTLMATMRTLVHHTSMSLEYCLVPVADLGGFLGFHGTPFWAGPSTKKYW